METTAYKIQDQNPTERYEKLYTMLLDAIPSSMLLIDKDMRVVTANQNFMEKSQRSMSNTIGHRLEEIFPSIILDEGRIKNQIRQVFHTNQPIKGGRITYRAPGITMRIYYYSILPFSWNGTVESAMLLMEDVTEQIRLSEEVRRMERHLASVVESAIDILLSTDTEGRLLTWNPAAERLSGYPLHEIKGHLFSDYCSGDQLREVKRVFSSLKTGKRSQIAEWDLVTKVGGHILVSWVFSPMKDDQGQTIGIVGVGRNMTEHRTLEMQLLQSQKLASLGVMAGGIAHEMRNPMAICSSAAQFLMEDDITPEFRKECAEKIYKAVNRGSIIIENLMKFACPVVNNGMGSLDLLSILRETMTLIAPNARIQKVEIKSTLPYGPVLIRGIASLLQQVFMNIFLNAINAMPDGGTLGVSVMKAGKEVLVHIEDTGHGISKRAMDKIFDPFYTTTNGGKGTGLGLSICYSIVKDHSGRIMVESAEGKGSTFTVLLPLL